MDLKPGTRVKIIDGYGHAEVEAVVERIDKTKSIIFVKEWLPNGHKLIYGVPLGTAQPVKPSLTDVVEALRVCFVKDEEE